jgi:hypothetical protein
MVGTHRVEPAGMMALESRVRPHLAGSLRPLRRSVSTLSAPAHATLVATGTTDRADCLALARIYSAISAGNLSFFIIQPHSAGSASAFLIPISHVQSRPH